MEVCLKSGEPISEVRSMGKMGGKILEFLENSKSIYGEGREVDT